MKLVNDCSIDPNDLLPFIVDNLEGPCYIADMHTYELLYINKPLCKLLGCDNTAISGQKCYQLLQNQSTPCSFCTNIHLKENEYYHWEHYNEYLDRYYDIKDTMIVYHGRNLRLEIASDVTLQKKRYAALESQISVEQMLVQCASTLCKDDDVFSAINEILAVVGRYYQANRAYLFEIDESEQYTNNTHEWCADGVEPQIDSLQKVPMSIIEDWMVKFSTIGAYSIDSLSNDLDVDSSDYKILEMQGIKSLLAVPLVDQGKIVGFLGVDDPTINRNDLQILQTISIFILDDLNKMNTADKLELMRNCDYLTGLYNRNYYVSVLNRLMQSRAQSVGVVCIDINGLKVINNKYGHSFGDSYIVNCVQVLREYFQEDIFRIAGDEFVIFVRDISYQDFDQMMLHLEQILKGNDQVSMSVGTSWCTNPSELAQHIKSADESMLKNKVNHYRNIDDCIQYFQYSSEELLTKEISNNNFEILIQPKVVLDDRSIIGGEALIRKKDELDNYIPPNLFISHYETQGTIFLIDLFVLRQVCEALCQAKTKGILNLPHLSLNFSRVTLLVPDIHIQAQSICCEYGLNPDSITIEVTEDCGFVESVAICHAIERLKLVGFQISLDDFGCKYSNIEILSSISFDEVKLDKSLLYNSSNNNQSSKQIILTHLIEMFQSFPDISIVVEGIEEDEHLNLLQHNDGLIGQGFIFSRPLTKDAFWQYYQQGHVPL